MGTRRVEITVPNADADFVQSVLEDPEKCGLGPDSDKHNILVRFQGLRDTIFFVTVPGSGVSYCLRNLRNNGIGLKNGKGTGNIILTPVEFMSPKFGAGPPKVPLKKDGEYEELEDEDSKRKKASAKKKNDFLAQKTTMTSEEIYNNISNGANMTTNTWFMLIGASIMAAGMDIFENNPINNSIAFFFFCNMFFLIILDNYRRSYCER